MNFFFDEEHDSFYKLLQIFRIFVTFEMHLSFFRHFLRSFITFFDASTFFFQIFFFQYLKNLFSIKHELRLW
jgi:hypothetical protein